MYKQTFLMMALLGGLTGGVVSMINAPSAIAQTVSQSNNASDELEDLLSRGQELVNQGDFGEALTVYERAAQLDRENARIYSGIGYLQTKQGNYAAAVDAYETAISLDGDNAAFYYALGYSLANTQDYAAAADAYRQAARLNPDDARTQLGLGIVLSRLGQYDEAVQAYQAVARSQPNNAQIHEAIGTVYMQRGDYTTALRSLQQAYNLASYNGSINLNLGLALINLNRPDEGWPLVEKAVELEPWDGAVHLSVGQIYQAQGNLEKALEHYRQATRYSPEMPEAQSAYGSLLLQNEEFLRAVIVYERLIAMLPNDPGAHYNYGLALRGQGRTEQAREEFATALSLYEAANNEAGIERTEAILELIND